MMMSLFAKIISDSAQHGFILQHYYPEPLYHFAPSQTQYKTCEDFIVRLAAAEDCSLDLFVNYFHKTIYIRKIFVPETLRHHGLANKLLNPLWQFYENFNFREIGLVIANTRFWQHIEETHPQIKLNPLNEKTNLFDYPPV